MDKLETPRITCGCGETHANTPKAQRDHVNGSERHYAYARRVWAAVQRLRVSAA